MILDEHKLIFIHIPKNAGTSIESIFLTEEYRKKYPVKIIERHATIYDVKDKFPEKYDLYIKFAVIRNPYERMVSWYCYVKQIVSEYNSRNMLYPEKIVNWNYTFLNFLNEPEKLTEIATESVGLKTNYNKLFKLQNTWVDNSVRIIKYENLNEVFFKLFKVNLPIKNKTIRDNYLNYYDKETLDIVYNKYKKDFEIYKYKRIIK